MIHVFRKLASNTTQDSVPAVGLQLKIMNKFVELKAAGALDFAEKKEPTLIDFIDAYPSIVSWARPT